MLIFNMTKKTRFMDCLYLNFLLLYVISTAFLSLTGCTAVRLARSAESKRAALHSFDPLTRRSPSVRNFMRFGRSISQTHHPNLMKREAYDYSNENVDSEVNYNNQQPKLASTQKSSSMMCLFPEGNANDADHLLCVSNQRNLTDSFYALIEPQDDSSSSKPNQTDFYLHGTRHSNIDSDRIRKSKGGNFMRQGRARLGKSMFNRYDRSRDNFMRLGRSWQADKDIDMVEKRQHNFMPLGRSDQYNRLPRRHDGNFIRLGRDAAEETSYERIPRGRDNFMRLGRMVDNMHNRSPRRHDSFMRLGRSHPSNDVPFERYTRKHDNFMRLGRSDATLLDRYMRAPHDRFIRFGRDAEQIDGIGWTTEKRSKGDNFMRLGRSQPQGDCTNQAGCGHDDTFRTQQNPNHLPAPPTLQQCETMMSAPFGLTVSRKQVQVCKEAYGQYLQHSNLPEAEGDNVVEEARRKGSLVHVGGWTASKCKGYQCMERTISGLDRWPSSSNLV